MAKKTSSSRSSKDNNNMFSFMFSEQQPRVITDNSNSTKMKKILDEAIEVDADVIITPKTTTTPINSSRTVVDGLLSPTSRSLMALSPTSRQIVASSLVSLNNTKKQNSCSSSSSSNDAAIEETEQEKEVSYRSRIARIRVQIPGESSSTNSSSGGNNNMQEEVTKLVNMDVNELTKLVEG